VNVQLAGASCEWPAVIGGLLRMLSPVFDEPPARVRARKHADAQQWNLLLQTATGRTIFLTIGCGGAKASSLDLLVIGNHGIAQLQGADDFDWEPETMSPIDWLASIDEAIASGHEIALPANRDQGSRKWSDGVME
jgi:hypothetical protein